MQVIVNCYLPDPPHLETAHTWHHITNRWAQMTKFSLENISHRKYPSSIPVYEVELSDNQIITVSLFMKLS